jgi:transposase
LRHARSGRHWARELRRLGHDVRLIPPQYVRPFVKTNRNDAADAEGICEAVVRPNMRFVPIKSLEQQAVMMLHRTRALLLRERTQLIKRSTRSPRRIRPRGARGARNIRELADLVLDTEASELPDAARATLILLLEQIREAQVRIRQTETALEVWAKTSDVCRRIMSIPGVGTMSATALVLTMDDPKRFSLGPSFCRLACARAEGEFERRPSSSSAALASAADGYVRTLLRDR